MYRQLSADRIRDTVQRLERRIAERFPDTGLRQVAAELTRVAEETRERAEAIRRPQWLLRCVVGLLLVTMAILVVQVPVQMRLGKVETVRDFIQVLDPTLSSLFFLSAFTVFLWSLEQRVKRARALKAIHELRSLAHVVDMHQLTKDPHAMHEGKATASSPKRTLSDFELYRYFDYCVELLSMISKCGALYAQDLRDSQALSAVDEIETLCTGLSRKIWQKVVLLSE